MNRLRPRILVADDSPTVTGILSYIFSEEGWDVETASDGVEALRRFYGNPPDLVVLDIEMPRMNGYQVCRILKDNPKAKDIPVVVLTSRDLQSDRFRGLAAGAEAYIVKNLEDDLLVTTIKTLLGKHNAQNLLSPVSVNDGQILEAVNSILDRKLFTSAVCGQVEAINSDISDYRSVRKQLIGLFGEVFEFVVGGVALIGVSQIDTTISLLNGFPEELAQSFQKLILQQLAVSSGSSGVSSVEFDLVKHNASSSRQFPFQTSITDNAWWPLRSNGEVIGIIGMAGTAPLKFDMEGKDLLSQFVSRAEIVLDNARLFAAHDYANRELEQTLAQLKEAQAQLIQNEKMASLGQLMAGLTHEMNNPLNFVSGNLEYLEKYSADLLKLAEYTSLKEINEDILTDLLKEIDYDYLRTDMPPMLADMRQGIERAKGIINDLRTFAAPDSATKAPADLKTIVEATLNILKREWENKIEIMRHYEPCPPIDCHGGQIGQVMMNLLTNAISAIKDAEVDGRIEILIKAKGDWIELSITDNGIGIEPENLEKLFQPFFTTRQVGAGMGLGLSISFGIVKKHGGEIVVASEHAKGSTFTIRLPQNHDRTQIESEGI